jgi:hypothetical protein
LPLAIIFRAFGAPQVELRLFVQSPLVIAHRVDDAIDRGRAGWQSYQSFRREHRKAYAQLLLSLSSIFVVIWMLMLGHGSVSFAGGFLLVMTLSFFATSLHSLWAKRTEQRQTRELASAKTQELPAAHDQPSLSVTEITTRELNWRSGKSGRRG